MIKKFIGIVSKLFLTTVLIDFIQFRIFKNENGLYEPRWASEGYNVFFLISFLETNLKLYGSNITRFHITRRSQPVFDPIL